MGETATYTVRGEPVSLDDAIRLASEDKFQFQWWALGLVGARPEEEKKGADKGIDGRTYFFDDNTGEVRQFIFSVKGGKLKATDVRDLRGVVDRENAEIGVLISVDAPTAPMHAEAASAGFYSQSAWNEHYPRLQIITVDQLLSGAKVAAPPGRATVTFKRATRAKSESSSNAMLEWED